MYVWCNIFFCTELLHIAGITTLQTPGGSSPLGPSSGIEQRSLSGGGGEEPTRHASDILDSTSFELKLDKSNILMLGPTGTGCHSICYWLLLPFMSQILARCLDVPVQH